MWKKRTKVREKVKKIIINERMDNIERSKIDTDRLIIKEIGKNEKKRKHKTRKTKLKERMEERTGRDKYRYTDR